MAAVDPQATRRFQRSVERAPKNSTHLGIIDRRTGRVSASVPFPDDQNPDLLPGPYTVVWHYVSFDYFTALLKNRAIWFTRLDKQSDKMDGTYGMANMSGRTGPVGDLLEKFGVRSPEWEQLQQTNSVLRRRTFVHCWSIRPHESAWMWNSFLRENSRSVAVRSTIGKVHFAIKDEPVELKRILYCPKDKPRPDYSYTAPFAAKDMAKYSEEREMRLIMTVPIGVDDDVDHKLVPVNLQGLIGKIVAHPLAARDFVEEIRFELRAHSIRAAVSRSQLRPCDLETVAIRSTAKG